jgi:hypothetical protein
LNASLRYTLVGDGASDRCLTTVINWVLAQIPELQERGFRFRVADLRSSAAPVAGLSRRLEEAWKQLPCDVLFVHRDAEARSLEERLEEISQAARRALIRPHVPVVPVRMTEAWLLIDEAAIRSAADNPSGRKSLELPSLRRIESVADPKEHLHACLIRAAEKSGRRLHRFQRDLPRRVQLVATLIQDYSPLRKLAAFRRFEEATRSVVLDLLRGPVSS